MVFIEGKIYELHFHVISIPEQDNENTVKFWGIYINNKLSREPHTTYILS